MSLLDISCGFDKRFFQLLKKKVGILRTEKEHRMLVYDEMFLRKSFSVNSQTLTYIGLEDLREESESFFSNKSLPQNYAKTFTC